MTFSIDLYPFPAILIDCGKTGSKILGANDLFKDLHRLSSEIYLIRIFLNLSYFQSKKLEILFPSS